MKYDGEGGVVKNNISERVRSPLEIIDTVLPLDTSSYCVVTNGCVHSRRSPAFQALSFLALIDQCGPIRYHLPVNDTRLQAGCLCRKDEISTSAPVDLITPYRDL